jgi:hypothetical protein
MRDGAAQHAPPGRVNVWRGTADGPPSYAGPQPLVRKRAAPRGGDLGRGGLAGQADVEERARAEEPAGQPAKRACGTAAV